MLLGGSNIMTLWQILNDLSACPPSWEDTSPGQRERPFQVGHRSTIGALTPEAIRVLQVKFVICPARYWRTSTAVGIYGLPILKARLLPTLPSNDCSTGTCR